VPLKVLACAVVVPSRAYPVACFAHQQGTNVLDGSWVFDGQQLPPRPEALPYWGLVFD